MGYKIFVSYKYSDDNVYPLYNPMKVFSLSSDRSSVRDYVDKLESYFDNTSKYIKANQIMKICHIYLMMQFGKNLKTEYMIALLQ